MKIFFVAFFLLVGCFFVQNQAIAQAVIKKDFLLGRFDYTADTSFARVPGKYTKTTVYLKKETLRAFLKMREAASAEGIKLKIISGTRSFYDQRDKWETKWYAHEFSRIKDTRQKVVRLLRWWSMPGTSRHHWGTEVDLNNMRLSYYRSAEGKKMYDWLNKNAYKYGFVQPFNANRASGYQEEKWHWSYAPLSRRYLREYIKRISYSDFRGFKGSTEAQGLNIITNWVSSVNAACK